MIKALHLLLRANHHTDNPLKHLDILKIILLPVALPTPVPPALTPQAMALPRPLADLPISPVRLQAHMAVHVLPLMQGLASGVAVAVDAAAGVAVAEVVSAAGVRAVTRSAEADSAGEAPV